MVQQKLRRSEEMHQSARSVQMGQQRKLELRELVREKAYMAGAMAV